MTALRLTPINIDENNWYYETKKGICFVHRVIDKEGIYVKTDQVYIPWKRLLESVKRKYNLKG